MTKAADIIAALAAGKPPLVFERRSGMTYGWGLWMRSLPERLGTIRSDLAEAMVGLLAQRPRRPLPPRVAAMGGWRAFRSLFYPHWDPPMREERGLRWLSGGISLLMHLLFVLLLVLVAMMRVPPLPPDASDGTRVQVEFIGQGTPEEEGGGPPAAEAASAPVAAQVPSPAPQPAAATAAPQVSTLPRQEQPAPSSPVAEQPLQVTETDTPTSRFVLPPPNAIVPEFVAPAIAAPELSVPTREVAVVEVPSAQRAPPQNEIAVPNQAEAVVDIREREIPTPVPRVSTVRVPARDIAAPDVRAPAPSVRQRDIPSPPSPAASGAARSDADLSANAPGSTGDESPSRQAQGSRPAATASGSASGPRNGALPSPRRGDDWGDAARNAPGQAGPGQTGTTPGLAGSLFNADGSVRLPSDGGAGRAPTAGPPGSRQAQQAEADRASKWLERPEYPYEPTMFDKYWVPSESLLAEWVRRAIREVEVPIPGTSKRVRCVVSVLQAGGACGLFDPNLNEQPATARPPPGIPVKRNPIPTDS